jgi:signal transduction histidine kinase
MTSPGDTSFARLVSLACHDLRTPLATVHGFARTIQRAGDVGEPTSRYVEMIAAASTQLADILDELGLVARIESGRYEPNLQDADTLELAQAAAARVEDGVDAEGRGGTVSVDVEAVERSLAGLANAARRHGGVPRVTIVAAGTSVTVAPVVPSAAPIVLGTDLRDLGAAIAGRAVAALGGEVELEGEELRVKLPPASG